MLRRIEPELLDSLPPDDPRAHHSRRDLRVINRAMGSARWFRRTVSTVALPNEAVLELGAGTGELCHQLRAHTPCIAGLDRLPAPLGWPSTAHWHQTDLQSFTAWAAYPVVIGNLILHHCNDGELRTLGVALRRHARVLIFSEPTRQRRRQFFWALAAPLGGANHITRHDGHVSIAAGFAGDDLPRLLGLDPSEWHWQIKQTWIGAYRFIAIRRT